MFLSAVRFSGLTAFIYKADKVPDDFMHVKHPPGKTLVDRFKRQSIFDCYTASFGTLALNCPSIGIDTKHSNDIRDGDVVLVSTRGPISDVRRYDKQFRKMLTGYKIPYSTRLNTPELERLRQWAGTKLNQAA